MPTDVQDPLTLTFAALADPTRRAMLARLATGEATVGELAEPFAVSLPAISQHLKVLERAGLVVRTRDAQWRPSRLQLDPLDEAVDWLLARRRTWDARMDRLEAHLRRTGENDEWSTDTTTTEDDAEVRITRVFDASRERVFRAWTDPDDVAMWFSPAPLTTPRESVRIDLRVGGRYELTMVMPDGAASPLGFEIVELDPPGCSCCAPTPCRTQVCPSRPSCGSSWRTRRPEPGARTRMTLSDGPYPTGFGVHAERGWRSAFDKLASVVAG